MIFIEIKYFSQTSFMKIFDKMTNEHENVKFNKWNTLDPVHQNNNNNNNKQTNKKQKATTTTYKRKKQQQHWKAPQTTTKFVLFAVTVSNVY